jgi:hypothetical protein
MSADLLHRAAAKLRLYASHASRGQWDAADDGLVWSARPGDPVSGSTEREDAEYIALMHPPVALALADLLDEAARCVGARIQAERHVGLPDGAIQTPDEVQALAVARAVLREADDA